MPARCSAWRTRHEQAGTDRHPDSEQGRGGIVHLQLGEAEGHVDSGTKGGAENHRAGFDEVEGREDSRLHVSAGPGTEERDADDACLGGAVQHEDEAQGHRAGAVQPAQQDIRVQGQRAVHGLRFHQQCDVCLRHRGNHGGGGQQDLAGADGLQRGFPQVRAEQGPGTAYVVLAPVLHGAERAGKAVPADD